MTHYWISEGLKLAHLQGDNRFPRDLRRHCLLHLPLTEVEVAALTTNTVSSWLEERGIEHGASSSRELHGCVVARRGCGILFLSADDTEEERAFTFAHELAHFLLDYLMPREKALRAFGDGIRCVLDGDRPPTKEELLGSALQGVPLGTTVHLMSRGTSGAICTWDVETAEQRADRLALELMVPGRVALAAIRAAISQQALDDEARMRAADVLRTRFGLPSGAAVSYVELLLGRSRDTRVSTLDLFGGR